MKTTTYCGELMNGEGWVGCIHKAENGYIIRKPDGRTIGPALFNGRIFKGSDFVKLGSTRISANVVERRYRLKEAA